MAPGETGVLYVRGPHVMAGYWRTARADGATCSWTGPLPGERMLCTQDHFTVDEDGFLYFVGRSDDIIKTRGEKVSPIEVENALFDIEGVQAGGGRRRSRRDCSARRSARSSSSTRARR